MLLKTSNADAAAESAKRALDVNAAGRFIKYFDKYIPNNIDGNKNRVAIISLRPNQPLIVRLIKARMHPDAKKAFRVGRIT